MTNITYTSNALNLLSQVGNELTFLWFQMEAWQELFDIEQEKRRELISTTAPGFFAVVQATLAESILMRIARLMDPPQSMCQDNSTVSSLRQALPSDNAYDVLRKDIQLLQDEWSKKDPATKLDQGAYAPLKLLRNKWLAHNDAKQRQSQPEDLLWIPLTHNDFVLAQQLSGKLWGIYRHASRLLRDTEVVEPQHSCLENRAAAVLKRLSESLYLDQLLNSMTDDERISHFGECQKSEQKHIGEDSVRHVFAKTHGSES